MLKLGRFREAGTSNFVFTTTTVYCKEFVIILSVFGEGLDFFVNCVNAGADASCLVWGRSQTTFRDFLPFLIPPSLLADRLT